MQGAECVNAPGDVAVCTAEEGLCPAVNCEGGWSDCDTSCGKVYTVAVQVSRLLIYQSPARSTDLLTIFSLLCSRRLLACRAPTRSL